MSERGRASSRVCPGAGIVNIEEGPKTYTLSGEARLDEVKTTLGLPLDCKLRIILRQRQGVKVYRVLGSSREFTVRPKGGRYSTML